MKINKKNTFFLFLMAMITLACSNDDTDNDDYFLKVKLNNESISFPSRFAGTMQENGMRAYFFVGLSNLVTGTPSFSITLQTTETLVTGTYALEEDNLSAEYIVSEGQSSYEANNEITPKDFTLVITAINSNTVEGTFSGTIKNPEGETITVTEGSFFLPWQVE